MDVGLSCSCSALQGKQKFGDTFRCCISDHKQDIFAARSGMAMNVPRLVTCLGCRLCFTSMDSLRYHHLTNNVTNGSHSLNPRQAVMRMFDFVAIAEALDSAKKDCDGDTYPYTPVPIWEIMGVTPGPTRQIQFAQLLKTIGMTSFIAEMSELYFRFVYWPMVFHGWERQRRLELVACRHARHKPQRTALFLSQMKAWRRFHLGYQAAFESWAPHSIFCPASKHDKHSQDQCYACSLVSADPDMVALAQLSSDIQILDDEFDEQMLDVHPSLFPHLSSWNAAVNEAFNLFRIHFFRLRYSRPGSARTLKCQCGLTRGNLQTQTRAPRSEPRDDSPQGLARWAQHWLRDALIRPELGEFWSLASDGDRVQDRSDGVFGPWLPHYHRCGWDKCKPEFELSASRICSLCVAQRLFVKAHYCSEECATSDWPRHRRLHQLFALGQTPAISFTLNEAQLKRIAKASRSGQGPKKPAWNQQPKKSKKNKSKQKW